jgi:hypothetical protein
LRYPLVSATIIRRKRGILSRGGLVSGQLFLIQGPVSAKTKLVQIQAHFALITFYCAPENFIAAFRTNVAGFFILNPFFSSHLSPIRNRDNNKVRKETT